ncbi:MAG: hypothetical protein CMJ64_07900 [Planctomycetaceae bacterium]|nr:hypothetical protein [Planctomycetaceae bacterium]
MNEQSPAGATCVRRGDSMSLLRGLGSYCEWFRGLTPTATSFRRCAASERLRAFFVSFVVTLLLAHTVTNADDWPQWRGPNRDAVSAETKLLSSWDEQPRLAWRASGLGDGYSSVVVSQGLVFTMGKHGQDVFLSALDVANGNPHWSRKIGTTSRNVCSTPTIDEDRIYALDPDGDLLCATTSSGDVLWRRSFLEDFGGRMMSGRGYGESPLIDGDKLICTPGGPDAMLVALNKRTGELIWRSAIPELGDKGRDGAGFSSIVISQAAGIRQYVQLVGRGLIGIDASSGRFLWGYNSISNGTANIPTPVARGDFVFAANGYHAGCVLLRLVSDDDRGVKAEEAYAHSGGKFQNHHGGVVLIGDHIYGGHGSNNGLPTCMEFETGTIQWKRRGPGTGSAALVYADGHLYFRYQNGLIALIEAAPDAYRLRGTFQLPVAGGDSWAHPVVAHGNLFLREQGHLFVYDVSGSGARSRRDVPEFALKTKAFQELRSRGVAVDSLEKPIANRSASISRLRRFLDARNEGSESIALITLTNKHLSKDGMIAEEVLDSLVGVERPVILSVAGTPITSDGLKQVAQLPLAGLHLELCQNVSDAELSELSRIESLQALWLTGTAVTHEGLRHLVSLPSLVALDLEVCDGITDASCNVLANMSKLRALILKKTGFELDRVTDVGVKQLATLEQLELLDLYANNLTDAGVEHLGHVKSLKSLDLSLVAITDKALPHLAGLTTLEHLSLLFSEGFAGPIVTDEGLDALQHLSALRSLNLTAAKITNTGLGPLKQLMQLEELQLSNTKITPEGVRQLKAALPGCEIRR